MDSVLAAILRRVPLELPGCRNLSHKKTWLAFLKLQRLPVDLKNLASTIRGVVGDAAYEVRGEKTLELRQRLEFTVNDKGRASRPEEALERMIVVANRTAAFNQVPLRGGKESLDLLLREPGDAAVFIELKPWLSSDTPLVALVELLKNLEIYRRIAACGGLGRGLFLNVRLMLLAPRQYYEAHGLVEPGALSEEMTVPAPAWRALLCGLGDYFSVGIECAALDFTATDFESVCLDLRRGLDAPGKVSADSGPVIPGLRRDAWRTVAAS